MIGNSGVERLLRVRRDAERDLCAEPAEQVHLVYLCDSRSLPVANRIDQNNAAGSRRACQLATRFGGTVVSKFSEEAP